jgi:hypothetical protein
MKMIIPEFATSQVPIAHTSKKPDLTVSFQRAPDRVSVTPQANRFSTVNKTPLVSGSKISIEQTQVKALQSVKNLSATGKMRMSDRQTEWFLTDKRLIFACSSL